MGLWSRDRRFPARLAADSASAHFVSARNRIGCAAPMFPPDLIARATALIARYRDAGLMAATAESCTGGLIAGLLTEIPGSSQCSSAVSSSIPTPPSRNCSAFRPRRSRARRGQRTYGGGDGRRRAQAPRAPRSRSASPESPGRTAAARRSRSALSISPAHGGAGRRSRARSGSATSDARRCASPRSRSGLICWRRLSAPDPRGGLLRRRELPKASSSHYRVNVWQIKI